MLLSNDIECIQKGANMSMCVSLCMCQCVCAGVCEHMHVCQVHEMTQNIEINKPQSSNMFTMTIFSPKKVS